MNKNAEIWKPIPGFDGYEASNLGGIRSLPRLDTKGRRRKSCVLKPCRNGKKGYVGVNILNKNLKLHRAVMFAFSGVRGSEWQVNHKNGIKADNRLENLEWATNQENCIHSYRELGRISSGGHKGKTGVKHHASKQVIARKLLTNETLAFGSTAEAARALGIGSGSIPRVCSGKYKHSAGWHFQYANND
jgi:hypothetical protein